MGRNAVAMIVISRLSCPEVAASDDGAIRLGVCASDPAQGPKRAQQAGIVSRPAPKWSREKTKQTFLDKIKL